MTGPSQIINPAVVPYRERAQPRRSNHISAPPTG